MPEGSSPVVPLSTRAIPSTGEALPVIGLGTWSTFDVAEAGERDARADLMAAFLRGGGRVIDSSPMYGEAESVVGHGFARLPSATRETVRRDAFVASKVWIRGRDAGIAQMERSMARMGKRPIDLMQVHNLVDVETHLRTLADWKAEGRVRYVGLTHYALSAFADLERWMRTQPIDFVQLPYSVAVREAERRLLPLAQERRIAVLVMRPFEEGDLLRRLGGRPLPAWAAELAASSWAELCLKFIVAHPAVTAVIPATSKPAHLAANLRAGTGPLPDAAACRRIVEAATA